MYYQMSSAHTKTLFSSFLFFARLIIIMVEGYHELKVLTDQTEFQRKQYFVYSYTGAMRLISPGRWFCEKCLSLLT